jgi:hypothetical protein
VGGYKENTILGTAFKTHLWKEMKNIEIWI